MCKVIIFTLLSTVFLKLAVSSATDFNLTEAFIVFKTQPTQQSINYY